MGTRRRTHRSAVAFIAAALVGVPALVPSAAVAAPGDDWWWDTYGIQSLHDAGATGAGVKIAVMDDLIDPSLPVFAGRDLRVADGTMCQETTTAVATGPTGGSVHGTTITAMMIGTAQGAGAIGGVAPDAEVTFYGLGREDESATCTLREEGVTALGAGVQRALQDGADIFTTSIGAEAPTERDGEILAEAIAAGMVIVNSTYNPSTASDFGVYDGTFTNGVVFASAVDSAGELQKLDDGQPLVIEGTRVVAAGVDMPTVGRAGGSWDEAGSASGSSYAAPLVAGMMALAAQQFPDASGNQLVQSLIHTTNGVKTDNPVEEPASGYGYGAAWPATMLADDPTAYPDENPLMDRESGWPRPEQLAAAVSARDGGAAPDAPDASSEPSDASAPNPMLPPIGLLVGIAVAVVALVVIAVVIIVIVVTRRNRAPRGGTP